MAEVSPRVFHATRWPQTTLSRLSLSQHTPVLWYSSKVSHFLVLMLLISFGHQTFFNEIKRENLLHFSDYSSPENWPSFAVELAFSGNRSIHAASPS